MRKFVLATSVILGMLLCAGPLLAGQAEDNTGCGLGTMLWGDKADGSIMSQSLQATTNGTLGNQTFGITSGTLGCDQPKNVASNERLTEFAFANIDNLARDIAMGRGESLDTLAELMDVPAGKRDLFYSRLQGNFDSIFVTSDDSSAAILDRIAAIN